ncbi:hypothetical protein B0H13DRAFT_2266227 [Mycena leptocephala]|nr:hypothetical protein B0H13DRAFT_2266227 [Mycena leptocephala]
MNEEEWVFLYTGVRNLPTTSLRRETRIDTRSRVLMYGQLSAFGDLAQWGAWRRRKGDGREDTRAMSVPSGTSTTGCSSVPISKAIPRMLGGADPPPPSRYPACWDLELVPGKKHSKKPLGRGVMARARFEQADPPHQLNTWEYVLLGGVDRPPPSRYCQMGCRECQSDAHKSWSTIELVFATPRLAETVTKCVATGCYGSDHRCIDVTINLTLGKVEPPTRYRWKDTDLEEFNSAMKNACRVAEHIDNAEDLDTLRWFTSELKQQLRELNTFKNRAAKKNTTQAERDAVKPA